MVGSFGTLRVKCIYNPYKCSFPQHHLAPLKLSKYTSYKWQVLVIPIFLNSVKFRKFQNDLRMLSQTYLHSIIHYSYWSQIEIGISARVISSEYPV